MTLYESTIKALASDATISGRMAALIDLIDQGHGPIRLAIMHRAVTDLRHCFVGSISDFKAMEAFIEAQAIHNLNNKDNGVFNNLISLDASTERPEATLYEKTVLAVAYLGLADSPGQLLSVFDMAQEPEQAVEMIRALTDLERVCAFNQPIFHFAIALITTMACRKFPEVPVDKFYNM